MGIFTNTPINGPINIIRLENKGKILYLLFDIHEELQFQTHCNVENSLDIDKFLAEAVKKVEGEIDFFIEASPSLLTDKAFAEDTQMGNYITNTQKWVAKNSNSLPKVRFHHTDIREYFDHLDVDDLDVHILGTHFKEIMTKLKDNLSIQKPILLDSKIGTKIEINRKKIFNKLIFQYNNKNVEKKIRGYINSSVVPRIKEAVAYYEKKIPKINQYLELLEYPSNKFYKTGYGLDYKTAKKTNTKIEFFVHKLTLHWLDAFMYLVDLHFLRRFLDKDYIKRAILYSGNFHCVHTMLVLCKYFDFSITHAYYSKVPIAKLQKIIRESKTDDPYSLLQYISPLNMQQCSNLKDFPEWFN